MTQNLTPTDENRLRVRARIVADDERVQQLREQEITVSMTDAEIDGLSGDALDVAVANTLPYGEIPEYHTDLGAGLSLLMGLDHVSIEWHGGALSVFGFESSDAMILAIQEPIATGRVADAAAVICRAYLKLKNRG